MYAFENLGMYASNHYLAMIYVSFNVMLRALSFETAVVPEPTGLSVLIKVLSNDL